MKWVAFGVLAIVLVPVVQADFLQVGGGPQGHHWVADDIASWQGAPILGAHYDLGYLAAGGAPPLVIGSDLFVLVSPPPPGNTNQWPEYEAAEAFVYKIDLEAGSVAPLESFASFATGFASDGELLYTWTNEGLVGLDLNGKLVWGPVDDGSRPAGSVTCGPFTIYEAKILLACLSVVEPPVSVPGAENDAETISWLAQVDLEGSWDWTFVPPRISGDHADDEGWVAVGEVVHYAVPGINSDPGWAIHAIDKEGTHLATLRSPEAAFDVPSQVDHSLRYSEVPEIAVQGDQVFVMAESLIMARFGDEYTVEWIESFGPPPPGPDDTDLHSLGPHLSLNGTRILAASGNRLAEYTTSGQQVWVRELDERPRADTRGLVVGGSLYSGLGSLTAPYRVLVSEVGVGGFDTVRNPFQHDLFHYYARQMQVAASDNMVIMMTLNSEIVIYGQTPTSPMAALEIDPFPQLGEVVSLQVNLESGRINGSVIVDWGDGTLETGRIDSLFQHRFMKEGHHEVNVLLSDGPIQGIASTDVNVGHVPPVPPSLIDEAFSAENQEMSFFILGLVVTLILAGFGTWRVARRHRRMRKELDKIEEVAASDASGKQKRLLLEERSQVARSLLGAGRISESQYQVLLQAIQAGEGQQRIQEVGLMFPFLPFGLVKILEGMLDDGRVTRWERDTILVALDQDASMTATQKRAVAKQVRKWFQGDAT